MKQKPIIELKKMGKVFYTDQVETHALSDINLTIHQGEFVSVSGPSGCGKSTLLSILGLLDLASSGEYYFDSENVTSFGIEKQASLRNRSIGFVFQNFNLIGELTVLENVELPLKYRGMKKKECRERALEAMDKLNIAHRLNHYPSQLSGGQQQRIAVARAIAGQTKIIFADEPTGNLDSKNGATVMEILETLHQNGTTICMVTHDERYADLANRTIHLFDGRIR